ncbi:hypothetical protein [Synechococcus sp. 1G10]|uniref:hypothetical protein n=1 Tax=Synechococcus sp. 1G10 TaxID=2025605 RepID=UPI001180D742|nr:hypothetical protein [Synechococcus sp. 1G10]
MALLLAASINGSPSTKIANATPPAAPCKITQEVTGTAPSDIVQKMFAAHFDAPLNRVDCRDNGLCYQTWGKDCKKANL